MQWNKYKYISSIKIQPCILISFSCQFFYIYCLFSLFEISIVYCLCQFSKLLVQKHYSMCARTIVSNKVMYLLKTTNKENANRVTAFCKVEINDNPFVIIEQCFSNGGT